MTTQGTQKRTPPCLESGIQRQLKPGGPKGIEGSTPSGGTLDRRDASTTTSIAGLESRKREIR